MVTTVHDASTLIQLQHVTNVPKCA